MQGENERKSKKISSIKRVVVQNNSKQMYKKSVRHVQSCFFADY